MGFKEFEAGGFEFREAFRGIQAVVDGGQLLVVFVLQSVVRNHFQLLFRFRTFAGCGGVPFFRRVLRTPSRLRRAPPTTSVGGYDSRRGYLLLRNALLHLCIFGQFFSLIRIGTIVGVTPFPTQIVNPVGETGAAEEEPAGDEQEYQGSGDVGPEEIGAPEHYLLAALPAEAASEYAGNPRQIAGKCQRKGTH